jgi:imidazolonepropionase-like amidohydrolase
VRERLARGCFVRLSCWLAAVALSCAAVADEVEAPLAFTRVAVFAPGEGFVHDRTVIVRGDRIESVAPAGAALPPGVREVDGRGWFLVPGFWDAHVHYGFIPALDHASMSELFIVNGVTSVRDTGGHLEALVHARAAAAAPDAAAPRLFVAGPLLDDPNRVYAGAEPGFPDIATGIATPSAAAAAVDDLAADGVDLVKVYELVPADVFRALVARATLHGLPVTAHPPLALDGFEVAASGIRGIEHLRNLELACARDHARLLEARRAMLRNPEGLPGSELRRRIHAAQRLAAFRNEDPARCGALIAALARHRVFQTPTLTITSGDAARLFADPAWRETFRLLPHPVGAEGRATAAVRLATPPAELAVAHTAWARAFVPRLHAAGVPIMAGTDTPIGLLTPGFSLHEELTMLVQAGLPAEAVIMSATLRPAEFLGLEDHLGTIEPGKLADLVLLDADPLADIRNTRRIRAVMRGGRLFDRAALDAMIEALEARGRAP